MPAALRGVQGSGVWETLYSHHDQLFADKVMTEDSWDRRRKATHRHRLQPMILLRVMLGYFPLLVWVVVLSVAVGIYDTTLVKWYSWPMLSIQSVQTFFSAITFALTLLLVFKTNSSYARWWEARKDVGQLVSLVHDIMRQTVAYFPPHQAHLVHAMARWAAASMWVGKALVRKGAPLKQELEGVLMPEELSWLMAQPHKQLALGQALSNIVAAADIHPMTKSSLDLMLNRWTFTFGAFGRIYNTAIPSAYTRHTSRFLMCYILIGLPLLLWPLAGWSSPVLAVLISFLLVGVENIGALIEEPFHVIAFDAFCVNVQRDVHNILAMHDNRQCSVCAVRSVGWGSTGGLVPVVRDLTYTPQQTAAAPAGAMPPQGQSAAAARQHALAQHADVVGIGVALPAVASGKVMTQSAAAAQQRTSLHLQVGVPRHQQLQTEPTALTPTQHAAVSWQTGASAVQLTQQEQQRHCESASQPLDERNQQQQLRPDQAANSSLRASESRTCLLSSHTHCE